MVMHILYNTIAKQFIRYILTSIILLCIYIHVKAIEQTHSRTVIDVKGFDHEGLHQFCN